MKTDEKGEQGSEHLNPSSSECDSNDTPQTKGKYLSFPPQKKTDDYLVCFNAEEPDMKEERAEGSPYFDVENDMLDNEYIDEEGPNSNSDLKAPDYAIANVSCQYEGSPGKTNLCVFC